MISVIVPVYGVEKYLDRCIQSIAAQTYRKLEILLVDDGSPDRCPEICDNWAGRDARIKVIHKQNGGLSDARNAGLLAASGEYIGFIDSDDWIHPQMYEKLYEILQSKKGEIAACAFQKAEQFQEEALYKKVEEGQTDCYEQPEALRQLIIEKGIQQVVWNKLYKRNLLEGTFFEYGKCNEDEFWTYQIIAKAKKVITTSYVGYYYFQRPGSIIGSRYSLKRLDALEGKAQRQEFLEQRFPELAGTGRLNLFYSYCYAYQCALRSMEEPEKKIALERIQAEIRKFPLQKRDCKEESLKQKIWIMLYHISLKGTCKIRNRWKIGL